MDETPEQMVERIAKQRGNGSADSAPEKTPKQRFLEAYVDDGTITGAAKAAGIDRQTFYNWKKADPEFAAAFEDAEEAAIESLEREARRRAKSRSDVLLIFLLKSKRPDVYADRTKNEHTGANGGPIEYADLTALTEEDLDAELRSVTAALEAADARHAAREAAKGAPAS